MGSRGAHLFQGSSQACNVSATTMKGLFFNEDEWEADVDANGMRDLAEAEAAALGLLEDGPNEVSLPLITSSSSPSGSDVLVTPPRRHGPSSDDEDTVPSGNRITIPQHQIVPWNRGLQPPPGSSSRPASAISPEATVGEAVGHGSGLL